MDQNMHEKLLAPFSDSDLEWRLQQTFPEDQGIAVPYVTNRAIQNRLDEVVGFENWKNEFSPWHSDDKKASQLCGISIYNKARKEWITKYDGAEDSAIKPIKGGLSDAMKRSAVQWGIGRYLYSMDMVWVKTETKGKNIYIAKSEAGKLNAAHQKAIKAVFGTQAGNPPEPDAAQSQPKAQQPPSGPHEIPKPQVAAKSAEAPIWVAGVLVTSNPDGSQDTSVQLKNEAGQTIMAYVKGTDPALVVGAALTNTKFSQKENQGVLFHILDQYEVVMQNAA